MVEVYSRGTAVNPLTTGGVSISYLTLTVYCDIECIF